MTEETDQIRLLTPRKIIIQVIAWLAGLALLAWIIWGAVEQGDWRRVLHADPWLIAALLGCTLASAFCNGAAFWITIQPVRAVRLRDMQLLNLVANMLNYAPVRLGALARVLYHLRVDRLSLLQIGGWFAFIGYVLMLGIGACLVATLLRTEIDLIWLALVIAQMVLGGLVIRTFAGTPLIARFARGIDRIATSPRGLWGALILRVLDLGAYTGRMWAASAILGLELSGSDIVVLAMVALAADLVPFGKLGFREFCVAATAARLSMRGDDVDAAFKQLALIDSAGQALIFIPLGGLALPWLRRRWRESAAEATSLPL